MANGQSAGDRDAALTRAVIEKFPSEQSKLERIEQALRGCVVKGPKGSVKNGLKGAPEDRAKVIRAFAGAVGRGHGRLRSSLRPKDRLLLEEFLKLGAKVILKSMPQRGNDFLTRQLLGRWAEQVVLSLQLPNCKIVAFGPSGAAMPGQDDYRQTVTTYGEIELLEGKRPDFVVFDSEAWDRLPVNAQVLTETWPTRLLDENDLDVVKHARFGIEVKMSAWHFGKRRERQTTLEEEEPNAPSEGTPPVGRLSITVKQEELSKIVAWMTQTGKPLLFFQVFFDEIHCMSFSRMMDAIRNAQLYVPKDYKLTKDRKTGKPTHNFRLDDTRHCCALVRYPEPSVAHVKTLPDGSVIPYVELSPAEAHDAQPSIIEEEVVIAEKALRLGLPEIPPVAIG